MQNQGTNAGVINWTNGTGLAVANEGVVDLGNRIGLALVAIASAAVGAVAVAGVFNLSKDSSVIAQEAEVYWSVTNSNVTTSPAAGDPRLGIAVLAAATGDSYVTVEINAPRTVGDTTVASGAGDAAGNAAAIIAIIGQLEQMGAIKKS